MVIAWVLSHPPYPRHPGPPKLWFRMTGPQKHTIQTPDLSSGGIRLDVYRGKKTTTIIMAGQPTPLETNDYTSWWFQPISKNMLVNWVIFPQYGLFLKPPPKPTNPKSHKKHLKSWVFPDSTRRYNSRFLATVRSHTIHYMAHLPTWKPSKNPPFHVGTLR